MPRSTLKGGPELKARLKAVRVAFKPVGKDWAEDTRSNARHLVRSYRQTGKLDRSFKVRATERRATVRARFVAVFINAGTVPHAIRARGSGLIFRAGGRTIFTKQVRHPGQRKTRFAWKAARDALRENSLREAVINAWNRAA